MINCDGQIITEIQKPVNLAGYEERLDLNNDGTIDNVSIVFHIKVSWKKVAGASLPEMV